MEECIESIKANGECLRGIIHNGNPANYKKTVLICLNTGLNDMVGWHRLQVKTARFLSERGYNVLRYDDTGIGDSDGLISDESVVEIFTKIETGMFVENANAMADYADRRFKDHTLAYLGFCGGGLTGIFSATVNKKIKGMISIGAPVTLSSNEYFYKRDPWVVQKNIEKYKSKLLNLRSWLRFLTFRGEYKTAFMSLFMFFRHKTSGAYSETSQSAEEGKKVNLNHEFFSTFKKFSRRNIPCLFFYAENDSATWEFKKYFLGPLKHNGRWKDELYTFYEAEGANHILSNQESQTLLNEHIIGFLEGMNN